MIKKLQALKAKKGFTLVELIVVIAIIGVLAAILVPTMMGYVTSSRVTSVNSTAASIKNNIDTFLTNADTGGYGMRKGDTNSLLTISIDSGVWTVTMTNVTGASAAFKNGGGKSWVANGVTGSAAMSKSGVTDPAVLLAVELADLFPEVQTGCIMAGLQGGKCMAVVYSPDAEDISTIGTTSVPTISNGAFVKSNDAYVFAWDGSTAGVTQNGYIVGTAPTVALG